MPRYTILVNQDGVTDEPVLYYSEDINELMKICVAILSKIAANYKLAHWSETGLVAEDLSVYLCKLTNGVPNRKLCIADATIVELKPASMFQFV